MMKLSSKKVATKLLDKHYSPMIVRKYQVKEGWPLFVGIICDESLSDLDEVVHASLEKCRENGMMQNDIQSLRDVTGFVSQNIIDYYDKKKTGCVEGVAVLWYCDKMWISSLFGDFMTHLSCKLELYQIINTMPHV
jgi:hypothetical protein